MKRKTKLSAVSIAAVIAFAAVTFLYKGIAVDKMDISVNGAQIISLFALAVMFAAVFIIRFIVPHFGTTGDNTKASTDAGTLVRCLDWAAWLLFALCLSALVASPLAGVADYFFYAACFGALSILCALFPCVNAAEKIAIRCERLPSTATFTAVSLLLCFVPAVGIYGGICGAVFSVTALREEKAEFKQGRLFLCVSVISTLLAAADTALFILLCR